VFGDYRTKYNERCEILPKIFAKVISEYYQITDYSCFKARIPEIIKKGSFDHRLSALISFIRFRRFSIFSNLSLTNLIRI